jgi:hypothetical protein
LAIPGSIARNVKVTFDPAPPSTVDIKPILEILKQGITSVPPGGRTMKWTLGAVHYTTDWDAHKTGTDRGRRTFRCH